MKVGNLIRSGYLITKTGEVHQWYERIDGPLMLDSQVQMMFQGMVLPVMKQLPTDALKEVRDFMVAEIDKELATRPNAVQDAN